MLRNHLHIELPPSNSVKLMNRFLLLLIIANLVYVGISFPSLPDEIPMHFNLMGEADGWGNKVFLLLFPLLFKPVLMMLYFFGKDPASYTTKINVTEENAAEVYGTVRKFLTVLNLQVGIIMFFISFHIIQTAKGIAIPGFLVFVLIGITIVTAIYYSVKLKKMSQ